MKLSDAINIAGASRLARPGASNKCGQHSDPVITGIHYRSDRITPGAIFVALPGQNADGHDFANDAVARGAAAVVVQRPVAVNDACVIEVENTRRALGALAAAFYEHPSRRLTLVGVTGTNGKTTTAYLLEHILRCSNLATGVIGTINYHYAGKTLKSGLTTPESVDLQHLLANMAEAGVTHAVVEVSSHGVVLDRIFGCRFEAGVFTNLSQDHLDFHHTMDDYWAAKRRFFHEYLRKDGQSGAVSVINMDDEKGRSLADELSVMRVIRVGSSPENTVCAERTRFDAGGIYGLMHLGEQTFEFHCPLVGRFNLENILCAAGGAMALGVPADTIKEGIETFVSVPGRLEPVPNTWDRHVFVDFSHTPAALENVLLTLREIVSGRLICIFGCGGDRDRGKRPKMGEIASRHADLVVVTSDNPRTESPEAIIDDILAGITGMTELAADSISPDFKSGTFTVEPDRRRAISMGIRASKPGDAVLIAGKGHETYQIIGKTTIAFDDRVEAEQVLSWGMNDITDAMDN